MKAIGTAIDVEERAELAAEVGTPPGEGSDRFFFMDLYAAMTRSYMRVSGANAEDFAAVVVKNQHNGGLNPRAQYGGELTIEQVLASRTVVDPLTLLMCSPISDGAAAVVLFSEKAARKAGISGPRIRASVVRSGNATITTTRSPAQPRWPPARPSSAPASAPRRSTAPSSTTPARRPS
jgi:acetyl-CoA acyltransferase